MSKIKRKLNKKNNCRSFASFYTKERRKERAAFLRENYDKQTIAWLNSDADDIYINVDEETDQVSIDIPNNLL